MNNTEFKNRYISARKRIIASRFPGLNDMQLKAVMATEGPLLLLAGAGSGKTTVVINRIANIMHFGRASDCDELPQGVGEAELGLLEDYAEKPDPVVRERVEALCKVEPCEPWRVIAITFTNKAADELKSRLETMLGAASGDIWAKTFHSACVRILRRYAEKLAFSTSFTIYDASDSLSLIKRIMKDMELDDKTYPPKAALGFIGKAKDALMKPEEVISQAKAMNDIRRQKLGEVYAVYEKRKQAADAMDFDDLLYYTVRLLEEHQDVREYYQNYFKYVLIDEYQDTNNLQYRLATALAGGRKNICVVGDDDQSIYKFRGATIENILSFESQYKNARMIRLEQNYRSTANILDAANAVIRNNVGRKGKELWTRQEGGDKLTLHTAQNENDEAQYVASKILEGFSQGINWRENVVLYRMNAQSNQMEYAFKRNGIPYRIVGGTRFFDRAEIKDMMSYLAVVMNPEDDLRLVRIINVPARALGEKTVETARAIAAREGRSLFDVVKHADSYGELDRSATKLRAFASMIENFRDAAENMPLDELFDMIVETTGYVKALQEKNLDENISRIENVGELKTNIISYINETGDGSLAGFLDEIALYTDLDSMDRSDDAVVMMTMHTAKGLEFENVFIIGVEEGIFPGIRSIGELDELEEERRLCYVGITRAKKKLTLCCARQRMLFGKTTGNMPSRFVEEIPEEYLERTGAFSNSSFSGGVTETAPKYRLSYSGGEKPVKKSFSAPPQKKAESSDYGFRTGDSVCHKAFGEGEIVKMTPMGGDFLVEVQFGAGMKKLMLRAAAPNMEKI